LIRKEESVLETFASDVLYAVRWLRKSPGFTLVAIASFAVGIGFNTAFFTLVDAALFRPLPVDRPDRLVDIYTTGGDGDTYATSSYPDYVDLKAQNEVFTDVMGYSPSLAAVNLTDRSRLALGEVVTGNYFQVLGVNAAIGRTLAPTDDIQGAERVVVLSHRLWDRDFGGSPKAVGRTLRIHGQPYTIVGVAPRGFTGMLPMLSPELWTATAWVEVEPRAFRMSSLAHWHDAARAPRSEVDVSQGTAETTATVDGRPRSSQDRGRLEAENAQTNRIDGSRSRNERGPHHQKPTACSFPSPRLMAVVGLVLLIACANVASLL
jgi:hypothetical protein